MTGPQVLTLFVVFVVVCLAVIAYAAYRDGKRRYERMRRQVRDDLAQPNPRGDLR